MPIRGSRHPHEVALLVAVLLGGMSGVLFFGHVATTSARTLPSPFGLVMYGGLAVLSAIALLGIVMHGVTAALLERAGLIGLAAFLIAYGIGIVVVAGLRGTGFALFVASFATANVLRARQIGRDVRHAYQVSEVIAPRSDEEAP